MITVMSVAYEKERSVQLATVMSTFLSRHLYSSMALPSGGRYSRVGSFRQLVPRFWVESPRPPKSTREFSLDGSGDPWSEVARGINGATATSVLC